MSLTVPPGYGLAAYVLDGPEGTGPFITTMGHRLHLGTDSAAVSAGRLYNLYVNNILARTSNTLTLTKVILTIGDDSGGLGSVVHEGSTKGSLSGADAAISMSVILAKQTGLLGRKGRGRCFLPGLLDNAEVDRNGDIGSAQVTAIQASVDDWYDDLTATAAPPDPPNDLAPYLLHSGATAPTPITGFAVRQKVGWIRKRIR